MTKQAEVARQNEMGGRRIATVKGSLRRLLKLRYVIALALIFWCAGAGCMMVSYARSTMGDVNASAIDAEQSMRGMSASMDAHACCKAKHKAVKRTRGARQLLNTEFTEFTLPLPIRSDAMSCCPLTSGSIVVASRSQSADGTFVLDQTESSLKLSSSNAIPVALPFRLPNRAHSYLLGCAFLI
ncbi:MAG TPA: hypothetical protein VE863_15795 [Pyrinomonadaceae bacterium]|jgi:hypothetical protein|nr:hypothetical protein [Pyrinomonadaceae bacterium]